MGMPFCISIFTLLLLSSPCKSDDTLTHAKPLFSGDKLVSRSRVFALGFFSPSSSDTSLFLGIWYNQIPDRRVVWVANRDNPIRTPSSARLAITNSSDLVLSDSQGHTSWTTKNDITAVGTAVAALLLDTGNFVLQFANGTYIWQSFDHPTDTILPTMKFLVSHKEQASGRLVAWKGPDDPSSGDFSCSGDPAFPDLQIIVWNGTRPYYRGVWNGQPVSGGMYLSNSSSVVVQTAVDQQDELFFSFTVSPGSPFALFMLDYAGKLTSLSWNNQSSSWAVIASHPDPDVVCDIYSSCGPFGYCDLTTGGSMCQCLDGFEPVDVNDVSKGCQRKETVKCGKRAQFVTLPQMKVPDKFLHIPNRSFEECAAECSANCSCTAYAYANFSHAIAKADMSRCLVWREELIDTEKYSSDSFFTAGKSVISGENLYLRLAHSPGKKNNLLKIVLPVVACLLIFICVTLIKILKYRGKQQTKEIQRRHILGYFNSSNGITRKNTEFPFVSFEDIAAATDDFSDSNLIGRGGFGKVYKGVLDGGKEVAIKRLSENSKHGIDEFKNEIVLFAKLQHKNLVRLLGCCIHGDERLLIYEYLPNKSLDAFVFGQYVLDWPTRFKIIKGVARGLLYLHQDSRLTIVHRDLKASNILLDKDMNPKISDFGMARIFCENQQQANTTRLVGTYGYMSPEYVMGGSFSVKSDTYSFGVLLLEIVSGMKISSPQLKMDFFSLTTFAWKLWQDGNARELVDSSIVESCPLDEVLRCIHVGLLCVEDCPNDRPLMSSVIYVLENGSVLLPAPKQPLYFCLRNHKTEEARKNVENSMNGMSTTLEGR